MSIAVSPEQIVALLTVGVGNALTTIVPLAVAVQLEALVTVTEYAPAVVDVMVAVDAVVLHK